MSASVCEAVSCALRSLKPWASDSPAARTVSREAAESGFTDSACQLPQNWLSRWVRPVSPGSSMIVSMFVSESALAWNCPRSEVPLR